MQSIVKRKFKITTNSSHKYTVVDNKFNREFTVIKENTVGYPTLPNIRTGQGWLYLTSVIDLFNRKVIGWALSSNMRAKDTRIAAFKMTLIIDQLKMISH